MAITVLDTPTLFTATSGSYTVPAGSNRLVLLIAGGKAAGDYTVTTRDAGGQTPTAIDRSHNTSGTFYPIDISYLTEAQIVAGGLASSAHTFSTTWSTTPGANVFLAVMTLDGVDQTTPVQMTHLNDSGVTFKNYPGQTVTCTLGTNTNGGLILISCNGGWVSAMTTTPSGFTVGYNGTPSGNSAFGIAYVAATGSSQNGTWGRAENSTVSAFGIAFAPSTGGGGPAVATDSALAGNRSRPGRGPYSIGRYYRRTRWLESDSPLASGSWSVAIQETGTAADAVSATLTAAATLAESASAADSMAAALAVVAALAETAAASDSLGSSLAAVAAISEAASAVDSVAAVLAAVAALSDSGAASDSVSAIASLVAALAESVTASDSVNWGGGTSYSADIAEAASATDSLSAALAALATLAESGNATDTQTALASLLAVVAEAGAALDVLTVGGVYNVTVTETGTASDTLSADGNLLPAPQSRTVSIRMANRTITVTATNRRIH